MPAKHQTTVALSKEAREAVDRALVRRGESMAGYFSNKAGGRFLGQGLVGEAKAAATRGATYGIPGADAEDPFGYIPRKALGPGVEYLDAFMRASGAAAEAQAAYDMELALNLFKTPEERGSDRHIAASQEASADSLGRIANKKMARRLLETGVL